MKFLTLLASTLLIVLIGQQSTWGLPVVHDIMNPIHGHVVPTTPLMVVAKRNDADRPKNTDKEDDEQADVHQVNEERAVDEKLDEKTETSTKFSEFCPENYVRFEDSCLFVKPKNKTSSGDISARVGLKENNLVQTFPALEDGSCPPGTEHTERGVCQKIISPTEMKPKHIERSCSGNARLIDGQCVVADELSFTTISMPLETSERMKVRSVMLEDSVEPATRSLPVVDSEMPLEAATRGLLVVDSEMPVESETRSLPIVDSEMPVESVTRSLPAVESDVAVRTVTSGLPEVESSTPFRRATRGLMVSQSVFPDKRGIRGVSVDDSDLEIEPATRSMPAVGSEFETTMESVHNH